jgi:hypothetical protein
MTRRELYKIPHRQRILVLPLFDAPSRVGSGFWLGHRQRIVEVGDQARGESEGGNYVSYFRGR